MDLPKQIVIHYNDNTICTINDNHFIKAFMEKIINWGHSKSLIYLRDPNNRLSTVINMMNVKDISFIY
jgi:hypothetical protein